MRHRKSQNWDDNSVNMPVATVNRLQETLSHHKTTRAQFDNPMNGGMGSPDRGFMKAVAARRNRSRSVGATKDMEGRRLARASVVSVMDIGVPDIVYEKVEAAAPITKATRLAANRSPVHSSVTSDNDRSESTSQGDVATPPSPTPAGSPVSLSPVVAQPRSMVRTVKQTNAFNGASLAAVNELRCMPQLSEVDIAEMKLGTLLVMNVQGRQFPLSCPVRQEEYKQRANRQVTILNGYTTTVLHGKYPEKWPPGVDVQVISKLGSVGPSIPLRSCACDRITTDKATVYRALGPHGRATMELASQENTTSPGEITCSIKISISLVSSTSGSVGFSQSIGAANDGKGGAQMPSSVAALLRLQGRRKGAFEATVDSCPRMPITKAARSDRRRSRSAREIGVFAVPAKPDSRCESALW